LPARKENAGLLVGRSSFPDADRNQKDSLDRQNELLEVPLILTTRRTSDILPFFEGIDK